MPDRPAPELRERICPPVPLRAGLPIVTVDMDGVFCSPIFGWNVGISTDFIDPGAPPRPARLVPRAIGDVLDYLRFDFRRPLPEAFVGLDLLSRVRTVVVLTGRRSSPERWMRRHQLRRFADAVVFNDTPLRSPHFKQRVIRDLGAREHLDDDGRTVQLLAETTDVACFLRDWPRNRDADYHPTIRRVPDILEFAVHLEQDGRG